MPAAACDDDLSSETQETVHVKDQDAKSNEHQPTIALNDNQALSVTTADIEVDDEWSKNNSEDADQVNCSFGLKLSISKNKRVNKNSNGTSKQLNLQY